MIHPFTRRDQAPCQLNLTALLDVVLQLIVFFILVSQLGLDEHPDLNLAHLQDPQVQRAGSDDRLIVSLLARSAEKGTDSSHSLTELASIQIGEATFQTADMPALTEFLASQIESQSNLRVFVRADASLPYQCVQPVLEALRTAGAVEIGLVTRAADSAS